MRPPLLPGHRWPRAAVALGIVIALGVLAWLPSGQTTKISLGPPCAFHAITGLPCALCGGTRAARAALHGEWTRAFELNALAFPALAILIAIALVLTIEASLGRTVMDWRIMKKRGWIMAAFLVIFLLIWWIPQLLGALRGTKPELLDTSNPIARALSQKFR